MPNTKANEPSFLPATPRQSTIQQYGRISKPGITKGRPNAQSKTQPPLPIYRDRSEDAKTNANSSKRKRDEGQESSDEAIEPPLKTAKTLDETSPNHRHPNSNTSISSPRKCPVKDLRTTPTKPCSTNVTSLPTPDTTPTKQRSPNPTLTKGQQRLSDLKSLVANAQTKPPVELPTPPSTPTRSTHLLSRTQSLHARLKAKAASRAAAPAPPSAEEVARCAALQRLPDVVRVLSLPPAQGTSARRWSASLKGLVQRIQESARSPMGKMEVERCLRLLEDEGEALSAVGFARVVKKCGVEAVVVDATYRPLDVEGRIRGMLSEVVR